MHDDSQPPDPIRSARDEVVSPSVRPADTRTPGERPGDVIDRYKLLQEIGEGGMGSVWMAEQKVPVSRKVALKIIKLGMDTKEVVARFEAERQALALMDHPGIAKVLDGGSTATGRPFFVMELVKGIPITQYCDEQKLPLRERLELFAKVCEAIQHAHHKGIIHRDVKPSNVLVTLHDGTPLPKVIDFGIAKATSAELTQRTMFTQFAQMIGTPEYMAPEQAAHSALDVDTRADVYSLGVLLYELLTGTKPFEITKVLEKGYQELLRTIREDDPAKPSTRVSTLGEEGTTVAGRRHLALDKLRSKLRGDLDWIVMKALEKDRTRRYETANGLAMDVHRYLRGDAVLAAPPTASYRFRKFVRRNRGTVAAVCLVAAALVLGVIGTAWQATIASDRAEAALSAEGEARLARDAAQARAAELEQVSDFQARMLAQIDQMTLGSQLSAAVNRRFVVALQKADVSEDQRKQRIDAFRQDWLLVNATDVALAFIDEAILQPALQAISEEFQTQPRVEARLQDSLARSYHLFGLFEQARPVQEAALATRRRVLGVEHPETIASLNNTARLLTDAGDYVAAEPLIRDVMEKARRVLGQDHPDTIICISNMALLLQLQGRLVEAEPYFHEALERSRRVLGNDHPTTMHALNNVALFLQASGRYAEAEQPYRETLERRRRILGEEHPDTLISMSNLGTLLQQMGVFDGAETYFREALEKYRRVRGEDHPSTASAILHLAGALRSAGKLGAAVAFCREGVEKRRRALGEEHPHTIASLNNLGAMLEAQGNAAAAEPLFRETLEKSRRVLGEDHPETINAGNNLGYVLHRLGDHANAERHLVAALATSRRVLGPDHPETVRIVNNLGGVYIFLGRLDAAEPLLREAAGKNGRILGEQHPTTLRTINNLASVYLSRQRFTEAEAMLREVVELSRVLRGGEHPETLMSTNNLGRALQAQGKLVEAESLFAGTVTSSLRALGEPHPITAMLLHHHAEILHKLGRHEEAIPAARRAHDLYGQHLDWPPGEADHAATVLATVLRDVGRLEEALATQRQHLAAVRKATPRANERLSNHLATHGISLVQHGTLEALLEAEATLRECLQIRLEVLPDDWRVPNTRSMLGAALTLIAQRDTSLTAERRASHLREAERLVLDGFEGLKNNEAVPAPAPGRDRRREALERVLLLYETWDRIEPGAGYDAKATEWRRQLDVPAADAPARVKRDGE